MYTLEAKNIYKSYAQHQALTDVTIRVPEKSVFGLLGPNGAGKTSLIRIINQITGPDSGTVLFNGEPLNPSHVEMIGYLPEERGLYKKMKVGEQCMYLAQLKGLSARESKLRLMEWFKRFDIHTWWDKKVEDLSKGMAQKVQFITTVLHEPKLLILDEPFSGFDPINAELIRTEMLRMKEAGATIILSTHDMGSVDSLCDNIVLINRSRVILEGGVKDIRNSFRTHTYEVQYDGHGMDIGIGLWASFELIENKKVDDTNIAQIRMRPDQKLNQLLGALIPHVEITAVKEIIPDMDQIFIQAVNKFNSENEITPKRPLIMNKIWLIIKREYLTKVKKKSFLVMTVLGPLIFGGIIIGMILVAKADTTTHDILIVDKMGWLIEDQVIKYDDAKLERTRFKDSDNTHYFFSKSPVNLNEELDSKKYTIIVELDSASYYDSKCVMSFNNAPSLAIQSSIKENIEGSLEEWKVKKEGMKYEDYKNLKVSMDVMMNNTKDASRDEKIYARAMIGFSTALIIYIFILIYGLQVMRGVMEEKTNRIVEVIISSVKPFQLMMGKIIGIGLVGLTQFLIWIFLTGIIGTIGASAIIGSSTDIKELSSKLNGPQTAITEAEMEKMAVSPELIELVYTTPWLDIAISFLFFFAAGYLLYASMFAAIGAAVDQESDTQQFQIPVTMPLIFGYIISIMMIQNPEGSLGTAFSIVPFTAPIVMMVKTAIGVELWLRLLSMTVLIGTFLGITWLAARIYRVGILMYGKKPTYKELWKWIRYSG